MKITGSLLDHKLIAFDLETSGKYPLGSEICEMAAVKWHQGQIIETFEALIKPSRLMSSEVIQIHGITNEMVENEPPIADRIHAFYEFVKDGVMMAHHAPFDMGFLAWDFEQSSLLPLSTPVLCTSLLSRNLIRESPNHRLITLAKTLGISPGNSHRALDDAKTCLEVGLECIRRMGEKNSLVDAIALQGQNLTWNDFSIENLREKDSGRILIRAILDQKDVAMTYSGGSRPGKERIVSPLGLVRGPERDFLVAADQTDNMAKEKRYYLNRIESVRFHLA